MTKKQRRKASEVASTTGRNRNIFAFNPTALFLGIDGLFPRLREPGNRGMDRFRCDQEFHAEEGGNGLKIVGVIQLLFQALKMCVIHVQGVWAVSVFSFKLLADVINKAQHDMYLRLLRNRYH